MCGMGKESEVCEMDNSGQIEILPEFQAFTKIPRLSREVVITEKIDGTNGQIYISEDSQIVLAGSRTKWITPENDNYGFAKWVETFREELLMLGPGRHFGEWWGPGIQRRYGQAEKRFSLFNTHRWGDPATRPACCHVVPTIAKGEFTTEVVEEALEILRQAGSFASPGFMRPEGIVIYHTASGGLFKKTLENDAKPKGSNE